MATSREYLDFLEEQLNDMGGISTRRMFGGAGLYKDGLMFGLVADDKLYLKTDPENEAKFIDEGLEPFMFQPKGKPAMAMSYREAPEAAMDDNELLTEWARIAFAAALRANAQKPKKSKKIKNPRQKSKG